MSASIQFVSGVDKYVRSVWALLLSVSIVAIVCVTEVSAEGTSKYGHPADCTCTSPLQFCEDEYVVTDLDTEDGAEYVGSPKYYSGTQICCYASPPGSCEFKTQTQQKTVDVGEWGGEISVLIEGGLPYGYSIEAGGKLFYNGSETKQVDITGETRCSNGGGCVAHDKNIGPGMTDRKVTLTFDHRCWGHPSDCDMNLVTCGHCYDQTAVADVTYLSSDIRDETVCNRALTLSEERICCDECRD